MRFIDTEALVSIKDDGTGPYRLEDGTLLRTHAARRAFVTQESARYVYDVYAAAHAATGFSPAPLDLVCVPGGFGVVVEYVEGINPALHMAIGSMSPQEVGHEMAVLMRSLHAAHMGTGRDYGARFDMYAKRLAPLLPAGLGDALVATVGAIPSGDTLLHGDFHIGNVCVTKDELRVIDMESAGFGNPIFDVAVVRSRMFYTIAPEADSYKFGALNAGEAALEAWDAFFEAYCQDVDADELAELRRLIAILSELDNCCLAYGMGADTPRPLTATQQARLAVATERLRELLAL